MNKRDDFFIRDIKNRGTKTHKKRTFAIAGVLCAVCVFGMAGIYSMEKRSSTQEEPLVNWEDNATSDTSDKVKVRLGSSETESPSATMPADVTGMESALNNLADTSLLEADIAEAELASSENTDEINTQDMTQTPVGQDAVTVEEEAETVSGQNSIALQFSAQDSLSWPVEGSVILDYSMDATTYFPTLDQYKYNPAILIQSEAGTQVLAAASGMVESIVESDETGLTVTMDIGGGYQLVYGQLQGLEYSTGTYIEKGAVVGNIAQPTKYYSVEGSNLYFKLLENGKPTDPVAFLKEGTVTE